jgi:succinate dehydrogenase / fumarate reductase flavoprotein subunit
MMQAKVGIVRNEPEMKEAIEGLKSLEERARRVGVTGHREYNPGWHTALDLRNLLVVSEAVARAALDREESRGAHFREDRPTKDTALDRTRLVLRKSAGGMELRREAVPPLPEELRRIIEENA